MTDNCLELGSWIGRIQAFDFVRHKCSAAQAQCLKRIRDEALYESLTLTWETFCSQLLGIHRSYADKLIRRLEEFGAGYFRLAEVMRIGPETYRAIEPAIVGETIELDGELIPMTAENAPRIRRGVAALRAEITRAKAVRPTPINLIELQTRLDSCFDLMSRLAQRIDDRGIQTAVAGLINYSHDRLNKVAAQLPLR
jgi:hypothetical protein